MITKIKINPQKIYFLNIVSTPECNVEIELSNNFQKYQFQILGIIVPESSTDVKVTIATGLLSFGRLSTSWSLKDISLKLKSSLYGTLILPIINRK